MKNTTKTERPPAEMEVRIFPNRGDGPAAAFAAVTMNGCFAIRDIRIMEGKNGPFVSMPSRKVNQAVLGAYEQTQRQNIRESQEPQESPEPQEGQEESGPTMAM